jgi:hypothetical protein
MVAAVSRLLPLVSLTVPQRVCVVYSIVRRIRLIGLTTAFDGGVGSVAVLARFIRSCSMITPVTDG